MPSIGTSSELRRPKKLIVCCDGTWMNSDGGHKRVPSNVTRLARAIKATDSHGSPQIVYYQAGIGTGLGLVSQLIGGGFGAGFSENVREAYAFLANNYNQYIDLSESDSIFLIGFSRGAYTARSLGGLIGQLGLLTKENMHWFYDIFSDWQNAGSRDYVPLFWKKWSDYNEEINGGDRHAPKHSPNDLKTVNLYLDEYRTSLLALGLTREALINAIGVFDTVGALGLPVPPLLTKWFGLPSFLHAYKWVDTTLDKHVKNAFHALALDEHRSPFFPSLWERPNNLDTNLKQVWFAGAHSNIGGAYRDTSTANITLAWMMDQLSGDSLKRDRATEWELRDWLEFDTTYLKEQRTLNRAYQRRAYNRPRSWALGTIYNSLTFPQLLAGSRTRRPGRTFPVLYPSEKQDTSRLLRDTGERVHASVRFRINQAGADFEPDPDAGFVARLFAAAVSVLLALTHVLLRRNARPYYRPHERGPLVGWVLRDGWTMHDEFAVTPMEEPVGHFTGRPPYWEWMGEDVMLRKGGVLEEDLLGTHELVLLEGYECAEWVIKSNRGLESATVAKERGKTSCDRSNTF